MREVHSYKVTVIGEVRTPGRYELKSEATVLDVLAMAGGLNEYAERGGIVILRQESGATKRIPFAYDKLTAEGRIEEEWRREFLRPARRCRFSSVARPVTPRTYHQTESQSGTELVLAIWHRRKWAALLVFAAASTVVMSLAVWLPDLYKAAATVLVERQQVSEAFVRQSVTAELETRIQTIRQDIMSRTRLLNLITRFNLYPELRERAPVEAIVERMRRDIQLDLKGVEQLSGRTATIAFTVSYTGRDPQTVALVANTLASFYVEENTKVRERQATRTAEFLRAQLDGIKKELDEQERLASDFKLRHIGELPQQMEANLASLERLNTQLRLNGENQIRAIDRRERLERQLAEAGPGTAAAVSVSAPTPASELAARKRELNELRRTFTDEYPDVIRIQSEIAALERQLAASPAGERQPVAPVDQGRLRVTQGLRDVDLELTSLKEEERALRQAIVGYEQRVENSPKRQQEFLELSRGSPGDERALRHAVEALRGSAAGGEPRAERRGRAVSHPRPGAPAAERGGAEPAFAWVSSGSSCHSRWRWA